MVQAQKVRIRLFEGNYQEVEERTNRFLRMIVQEDVVSVQYSYQAPEVGLQARAIEQVAPATHGVCVVLAEQAGPPCVAVEEETQ